MDILLKIIPELTQGQWFGHGLIFILNIALFVLARPLLNLIAPNQNNDAKIKIFRALNILVLLLHVLDLVLTGANSNYRHYFINLGYSLMIIYAGMIAYSFFGTLSKRRFGRERIVDQKKVYSETYSTRLVNLILLVLIIVTTIYALILIWGANSLLETTGIFGILMAFLAFTSSVWAPDIISGLIILNSESIEDGDVVVIDGHSNEYVISRVTLIYVILYDIRNNHRTLMRNSLFTSNRVDNLSRVASTKGVRQALKYNIGYPQFTGHAGERAAQLAEFKDSIDKLFSGAEESCKANEDIKINETIAFEWALTSAGDYALEYTLWIYLERIPNTKITSTLRKHLMGTIYKVNEAVYTSSILENIDLSTPDVIQATVTTSAPQVQPKPAPVTKHKRPEKADSNLPMA